MPGTFRIFAFATAFAVWHSLPHLRWMRESLQLPWTQLWRRLSLPTLVSAAGTVALFGGLEAHHALVAIAALTVPHALWVHRTFTSQPLVLSERYGAR